MKVIVSIPSMVHYESSLLHIVALPGAWCKGKGFVEVESCYVEFVDVGK